MIDSQNMVTCIFIQLCDFLGGSTNSLILMIESINCFYFQILNTILSNFQIHRNNIWIFYLSDFYFKTTYKVRIKQIIVIVFKYFYYGNISRCDIIEKRNNTAEYWGFPQDMSKHQNVGQLKKMVSYNPFLFYFIIQKRNRRICRLEVSINIPRD